MPTNELTPTLEAEPIVETLPTDEASPIVDATPTQEMWRASEPITPIPNVSYDDLLRVVHILARSEKFRLLQFVVAELAEYEKEESLELRGEYPILTPYDQYEAAHALMEMMEQAKEASSD